MISYAVFKITYSIICVSFPLKHKMLNEVLLWCSYLYLQILQLN